MKEHELLRECLETLRVHMRGDLAERIEAYINPEMPEVEHWGDIVDAVEKVTLVYYSGMDSRSRVREIVEARYIAMALIRQLLPMTHSKVGFLFSRDHSTVTYAIKTVSKWLATDKNFRDKFNAVKSELWKNH